MNISWKFIFLQNNRRLLKFFGYLLSTSDSEKYQDIVLEINYEEIETCLNQVEIIP